MWFRMAILLYVPKGVSTLTIDPKPTIGEPKDGRYHGDGQWQRKRRSLRGRDETGRRRIFIFVHKELGF